MDVIATTSGAVLKTFFGGLSFDFDCLRFCGFKKF